jgi:hypothetical protein
MPRFRLSRQPTIITRADRARAAGEWQLAAGLYRVALDRTPHNPPIWIQYGHAVKECGHCQLKPSWYALRVGGGQLGIWKRKACLLSCPEIGGQGGKKAGSAR